MTSSLSANSIVILVVAILTSIVVSAQGEFVDKSTPDCSSSKYQNKNNTKPRKMISYGVINGRAIHLEQPAFPAAALAVGVRGDVQVSVVIDPDGCVNEAKLLSGHALLSSASLEAAKKSSFEPVTISGNATWMYGIMIYKYLCKEMNWLELGYNATDFERMLEFFPSRLHSQRLVLENVRSAEWTEKQDALATVHSAVIDHGIVDAKSSWLFRFGSWLKELERTSTADEKSKLLLSRMLDSVPIDVNPNLIRSADLLHKQTDREDMKSTLQSLRTNMFILGN